MRPILSNSSPCCNGVSSRDSFDGAEYEVDSSGPVRDGMMEGNGLSSREQAPLPNEANLLNFSNSRGSVDGCLEKSKDASLSPCGSGASSGDVFENESRDGFEDQTVKEEKQTN